MEFKTLFKIGIFAIGSVILFKVYQNRGELFSSQKELYQQSQEQNKVTRKQEDIPEQKKKVTVNYYEKLNNQEELLREVNNLNHSLNKEFLEFAFKNINEFSPKVLHAFVDRVGKFKDSRIDKLLKDYARSADDSLRRRAIRSLGRIQDLEREKILKALYDKRLQTSEEEQVEIIASYYQSLSDGKLIAKLEKDLLRIVNDSQNQEGIFLALMQLNKIDPENKQVINYAKDFLKEEKFPEHVELNNLVIRILARYSPKFIEKDFLNFMKHPSTRVQVELVNVLSVVCPKNIWDLFSEILNRHQNTRVHLALMRQLMFFNSIKAEEFLEKNKDVFKIDQDRWRKIRLKILESELTDTCESVRLKKRK